MKSNTRTYFNLIGDGVIENGIVTDIGKGYVVPDINLFVDGFEYQRTDGFDWYKKTYYKKTNLINGIEVLQEFQRNDVILLIKQNRVRIKNG
jgi:hypothetical protein